MGHGRFEALGRKVVREKNRIKGFPSYCAELENYIYIHLQRRPYMKYDILSLVLSGVKRNAQRHVDASCCPHIRYLSGT